MKLVLHLDKDVENRLRRLADGMEQDLEIAATTALREMLIGLGFIPEPLLEEDSEVAGNA